MSTQKNCFTGTGALYNPVLHLSRCNRIESISRLIQYIDQRFMELCAGKPELPLHSRRVVDCKFISSFGKRELFEKLRDLSFQTIAAETMHLSDKAHYLLTTKIIVKSGIVRKVPYPPLHLCSLPLAIKTMYTRLACRWNQHSHQKTNRGSFSSPIWS